MIKQFAHFFVVTGMGLSGLMALGTPAQAAFTVNATVGGSALGGASYANFDNGTTATTGAPGTLTASLGTGAAFVSGSVGGQYATPVLSGGNNLFFGAPTTGNDATTYLSTGGSSITLTFGGAGETYFGLLWGSVDSYNSLSFFDASGNLLQSFGGTNLGAGALGNTVYANFIPTVAFTTVVASASTPSFEFDNVAFAPSVVPEPSSMALCGVAGVISLVAAKRRKRTA